MTTTIERLGQWISAPREDENLEFKEARNTYDTSKLYRYCVAIANEGGGRLILGVSDRPPRRIVGTSAFGDTADIANKVFTKLRFRVDVEDLRHPDGRVLIFHIPSRPRGTAYSCEGAYLMRSTEDTVAMSEDRLRQIFEEGRPEWELQTALGGLGASDVIRLLDTQSYFDLQRFPYPTDQAGVVDRFEREHLVGREGGALVITNLGAILFAKQLDAFGLLARRAPRVVVYEGDSKLVTRVDQQGQKGYATGFAGLIQVLRTLIPTNELIEQALRREVRMFPDIAVRELLANALIHQDFMEPGASVMIELYSDRLEISNPGKPVIDPNRLIDEYSSRNERLADLMRRVGICEEKGSGVDKVVDSAEVLQLPAPDFRVTPHRTTAVMFAHKGFEDMDAKDRIRACYQHCCLRYVMNQRMTNQTLRTRFQLPAGKTETVSRIIRDAVDQDWVKLEDPNGSKRYARYVPFWA